jgi:hypothetical protein
MTWAGLLLSGYVSTLSEGLKETGKDYSEVTNMSYFTKTLITNKCTKGVLSLIVTHSYMFRPCWVIFREKLFVTVTVRLHFTVE